MASIALVNIQPIEILANDTYDLETLKRAYNTSIASAQKLLPQVNDLVNQAQPVLNQLNTVLGQANVLAQRINELQPQAQVYGAQAISTIQVQVTGQVNLV